MNNILTPLQAYKVMICFLDNYYNKTLSNDLGSLLGDLQLSNDGTPFDPAAWHDWIKALGNDQQITTMDAFRAMINFLDDYSKRTSSLDIQILINDIQQEKDSWIKCMNDVIEGK